MRVNHWTVLLALVVAAGMAAADEPKFETVVIDRGNAEGVSVIDVNGDGLLDIVAVPNWYRAPFWDERQVTDPTAMRQGEFIMNYGQAPMDVNGDGAMDVVSGGWFTKEVAWYENPTGKKPWKKLGDEFVMWPKHLFATLPQQGGGPEAVLAADIDGDGQLDIVPNQRPLGWWKVEKDAQGNIVPKRYPIDATQVTVTGDGQKTLRQLIQADPKAQPFLETYMKRYAKQLDRVVPKDEAMPLVREDEWQHGAGYGDVNGDGRKDIVTNDGWFEAPADLKTGEWIAHRDFRFHDASVPILVLDVDGDGDNDLIYGHGHSYGTFFVENTGKEGKERWVTHEIDKTVSQVHTMVWADIDADGKPELVTAKRWRGHGDDDPGSFDPLGIYYYDFDPATKGWTKHVIRHDEHIGGGMQLTVVDVDKDGDLDIVAPGKSGVYLLKNLAKTDAARPAETIYRPKP